MSSILDKHTVAEILLTELNSRKLRNDFYSLRAFARDLEISASRLSEVMKGSHGLSEKTATNIATKLKLNALEKKFWFDLVLSESSRNKKIKELATKRLVEVRKLNKMNSLKENQFRVLADWYHAAILEIVHLDNFQNNIPWISTKLGISEEQATLAVDRLKLLGLLEITTEGQWQVHPEAYDIFSEVPSIAIRKFHRQVLQNGIESLLNDPMENRAIQSMIVAIPKDRLPEFQQKMKTVLYNFWQDLSDSPKNELYSLSIQLVPIGQRQ